MATDWYKAGRHSSQGYMLSDLVGKEQVSKLLKAAVDSAYAAGRPVSVKRFADAVETQFKANFFAGDYCTDTDMIVAARIYVNAFYRQLQHHMLSDIHKSTIEDLIEVLKSADLDEFIRFCNEWDRMEPVRIYRTRLALEVAMHQLRIASRMTSDEEKEESVRFLAKAFRS